MDWFTKPSCRTEGVLGEPERPAPRDYFWLWTVEECAQALRMSPGTLRNIGSKGPPKVKLGGRVWYRPEAVGAWLDKQ